ncbi:MAG: biotin--[acetyl-CoA-carboxylase] ligase [Arcobacteraceae bacterium]|jgi:BirA family biotin operon repressor/biotin-[acetyl-CoA-carboxylase] ligase
MEIIFLKEVDSTHKYLKTLISENGFTKPLAIVTTNQTNGIGSRDNSWNGIMGNLFFSFVVSKNDLPNDLKIESASIYFSFLLKEILKDLGSNVWLKWPNDFYIEDKKIGGTITTLSNDLLYCGIGLNLQQVSDIYGFLDINIDMHVLLEKYFESIFSGITWKCIFSKFQIEFSPSKNFKTTINHEKVPLLDAILLEDGSLMIDNKKVYSSR